MHVNLAFLAAGIWCVGTGIDGVVPGVTASGVLKVVGGVIFIIAAFVGA
jgi:hypothetical protein